VKLGCIANLVMDRLLIGFNASVILPTFLFFSQGLKINAALARTAATTCYCSCCKLFVPGS